MLTEQFTIPSKKGRSFLRSCLLFLFLVCLYISFSRPAQAAENLRFIHTDHLGSTTLISDQNGRIIARQNYYPYGSARSREGGQLTERQYTGQVSDQAQIGLYYYNARYYDPNVAKFSQADSNEGPNRYAYVENSPMVSVDPTGNQCIGANCRGKPYWDQESLVYFTQYFENFVLNEIGPKQWLAMSKKEKIESLSGLVSRISYSPRISEVNTRLGKLKEENAISKIKSGWNLNMFQEKNPGIESREMIKLLAEEEIARRQRQEEIAQLSRQDAELFLLSLNSSFYELLERGLFTCKNFADLLSFGVDNFTPDSEIYSAYVFYHSSQPGHAFNIVNLDDQLYHIDPTWGSELSPLGEQMTQQSWFNWRTLGYDPETSSAMASDLSFYDHLMRLFTDLSIFQIP